MGPSARARQKEAERWALESARATSSFFPAGEIVLAEAPDLIIQTSGGPIGVEVTELIRPKRENPYSPVQDEDFHKKVVRLAEDEYYKEQGSMAVRVSAYFLGEQRLKLENLQGWKRLTDLETGRKLDKMVRSLSQFVKKQSLAGRWGTFEKREMAGQMDEDTLPTGFEVVGISIPAGRWTASGESAMHLAPLEREELSDVIARKNALVSKYRTRAPDMPLWLLIQSALSVSKGVPIPREVSDWRFTFNFDRVFLYSAMDGRVFEIGQI